MIDISDITTLDPADIDRKMAHRFAGKRYAYVAVTRKGAFQLGVSVAGKVGFIPVGGMTFVQKIEAWALAHHLNKYIGLSDSEAIAVVGWEEG